MKLCQQVLIVDGSFSAPLPLFACTTSATPTMWWHVMTEMWFFFCPPDLDIVSKRVERRISFVRQFARKVLCECQSKTSRVGDEKQLLACRNLNKSYTIPALTPLDIAVFQTIRRQSKNRKHQKCSHLGCWDVLGRSHATDVMVGRHFPASRSFGFGLTKKPKSRHHPLTSEPLPLPTSPVAHV